MMPAVDFDILFEIILLSVFSIIIVIMLYLTPIRIRGGYSRAIALFVALFFPFAVALLSSGWCSLSSNNEVAALYLTFSVISWLLCGAFFMSSLFEATGTKAEVGERFKKYSILCCPIIITPLFLDIWSSVLITAYFAVFYELIQTCKLVVGSRLFALR